MAIASLRIAHIDTERTWRGGQNQVCSLIHGLADKGHRNLAVVRPGAPLHKRLAGLPCDIFRAAPIGDWNFIEARRLNAKLKAAGIDVVHAHTGHAVSLAAMATFGTRIPFVLTRRVDFPIARNPFTTWKYSRAQRLIAISNRVRQLLIERGFPVEKISLVPSGVDFDRFLKLTPVNLSEWGVPSDSLVVGQVAALAPHKDQATFLRGMALLIRRLPRVHAVLVGEGSQRSDLEDLAADLAIASHVHFMGHREAPLDFLAAFDIFCLTSKLEGLGTSILDAMALKVPVVATRAGGIPDMIEDGVSGCLVPPGDPVATADALEELIRNPERKKQIKEAAFQKVRDFDIDYTVSKTELIYREVLEHFNPDAVS